MLTKAVGETDKRKTHSKLGFLDIYSSNLRGEYYRKSE